MLCLAGDAAGRLAGSFALRRARKAHRCARKTRFTGHGRERRLEVLGRHWDGGPIPAACTQEILPGEQYVEYTGCAMPYDSGPRYCAHCAAAAGLAEVIHGGPLATAGVGVEAGTTTPGSRTPGMPSPPAAGGPPEVVSMPDTMGQRGPGSHVQSEEDRT